MAVESKAETNRYCDRCREDIDRNLKTVCIKAGHAQKTADSMTPRWVFTLAMILSFGAIGTATITAFSTRNMVIKDLTVISSQLKDIERHMKEWHPIYYKTNTANVSENLRQ